VLASPAARLLQLCIYNELHKLPALLAIICRNVAACLLAPHMVAQTAKKILFM
jgi:hypothetical protein